MSLSLTATERTVLQACAASRAEAARTLQRARIVLAAADGRGNAKIAQEVGLVRQAVVRWRERFASERLAGLEERPQPGKPSSNGDADRLRFIEMACTQAPDAETHWSARGTSQAKSMGSHRHLWGVVQRAGRPAKTPPTPPVGPPGAS